MRIWPPRWHGRIALVASVLAALTSLSVMADFSDTGSGFDLNAVLVVGVVAPPAIAVLLMMGRYLDHRFAETTFVEAAIRMFVVLTILLAASSWMMNAGIFSRSDWAFVGMGIAAVGAALLTRLLVASLLAPDATRAAPTAANGAGSVTAQAEPHRPIGTVQSAKHPLDGPPQWPAAPPTAAIPSASPASERAGAPRPLAEPPYSAKRRATIHRLISGLITLAWIPLGLMYLFVANYCPNDGTADAVWKTSLILVIVQLVGNMVAGVVLDLRYGNRGGTLLAMGRCVVVAIVLFFLVAWLLGMFVPDGPSRYCG